MKAAHRIFILTYIAFFLSILIVPATSIRAQEAMDSTKKVIEKKIAIYFPSTRFIDVQYDQFSEGNYTSDLYDKPFEKGNLRKQYRVKVAMNVPLASRDRWNLKLALRYKIESFEFNDIENQPTEGAPIYHAHNESFHFFSAGLQYSYYSTLWGKTVMYRAILFSEGSEGGFERINATLTGNMVMKKTDRSMFALGLLLQSNNTSVFPILPIITYEYQFANSPWQAEIVLPRYAYLRRPLKKDKSWITIGTSFDGETFYVYPHKQEGLKEVYQFNRNEIKTGFNYEHMVARGFIMSLRAGVSMTLPASFRERGAIDKIMSVSQDANGYFNVGISYSPMKKN